METQTIKTPFYKSKAFVIPVVGLMALALVTAAVIVFTTHATVTVNEALTTTDISVTPSGYPGETITQDITIQNDASVSLPITLAWTETANVDSVDEDYLGPIATVLAPGPNTITLMWDISTGSNNGTFEGDITITRV